jgi:hypothetical protein
MNPLAWGVVSTACTVCHFFLIALKVVVGVLHKLREDSKLAREEDWIKIKESGGGATRLMRRRAKFLLCFS